MNIVAIVSDMQAKGDQQITGIINALRYVSGFTSKKQGGTQHYKRTRRFFLSMWKNDIVIVYQVHGLAYSETLKRKLQDIRVIYCGNVVEEGGDATETWPDLVMTAKQDIGEKA